MVGTRPSSLHWLHTALCIVLPDLEPHPPLPLKARTTTLHTTPTELLISDLRFERCGRIKAGDEVTQVSTMAQVSAHMYLLCI